MSLPLRRNSLGRDSSSPNVLPPRKQLYDRAPKPKVRPDIQLYSPNPPQKSPDVNIWVQFSLGKDSLKLEDGTAAELCLRCSEHIRSVCTPRLTPPNSTQRRGTVPCTPPSYAQPQRRGSTPQAEYNKSPMIQRRTSLGDNQPACSEEKPRSQTPNTERTDTERILLKELKTERRQNRLLEMALKQITEAMRRQDEELASENLALRRSLSQLNRSTQVAQDDKSIQVEFQEKVASSQNQLEQYILKLRQLQVTLEAERTCNSTLQEKLSKTDTDIKALMQERETLMAEIQKLKNEAEEAKKKNNNPEVSSVPLPESATDKPKTTNTDVFLDSDDYKRMLKERESMETELNLMKKHVDEMAKELQAVRQDIKAQQLPNTTASPAANKTNQLTRTDSTGSVSLEAQIAALKKTIIAHSRAEETAKSQLAAERDHRLVTQKRANELTRERDGMKEELNRMKQLLEQAQRATEALVQKSNEVSTNHHESNSSKNASLPTPSNSPSKQLAVSSENIDKVSTFLIQDQKEASDELPGKPLQTVNDGDVAMIAAQLRRAGRRIKTQPQALPLTQDEASGILAAGRRLLERISALANRKGGEESLSVVKAIQRYQTLQWVVESASSTNKSPSHSEDKLEEGNTTQHSWKAIVEATLGLYSMLCESTEPGGACF